MFIKALEVNVHFKHKQQKQMIWKHQSKSSDNAFKMV